MKLQMVDDWKIAWRWWSVRLAALVAVAPEALYRLAIALGDVLPTLSSTVVENLPPWLRATLAVGGALATFLRLVKQFDTAPPGKDNSA